MFKFNVKWTPAQTLIFHLAISGLISAVVAGLLAAGQFITTTGLNLPELGRIFATAFLASFTACYLSIKNNPNTGQAIMDSLSELKGLVTQPLQVGPLMQAPQQAAGPLVVQHITQLPESANVTPAPSVRSLNTVPMRPVVQPPIQMSNPQAVPVVDVASLSTQQVQAVPQVSFPIERSFSGVMPSVQG